jgi:hypothetical protein
MVKPGLSKSQFAHSRKVPSLIRTLAPIRLRLGFLRCRRRLERLEGVNVIIVGAMMRSGHHAVISWIMNGLEGREVEFVNDGRSKSPTGGATPNGSPRLSQVVRYDGGSIIHINDVPARWTHERKSFWRWMPSHDDLKNCRYLIISYEDVNLSKAFPKWQLHRRPHRRIYVQRQLANNVASRVQGNISFVQKGVRSFFHTDGQYFDTFMANSMLPEDSWMTIDFDQWASGDAKYRNSLIEALGLKADVQPGMSRFGGGSSFTGTSSVPTPEQVTNRWRNTQWHPRLVKTMLASRAAALLTEEQTKWFQDILSSGDATTAAPTINHGRH